jgi:hypothetical protein
MADDGAGGHCFTVRFDGASSLEADTVPGRTTAERIYEGGVARVVEI